MRQTYTKKLGTHITISSKDVAHISFTSFAIQINSGFAAQKKLYAQRDFKILEGTFQSYTALLFYSWFIFYKGCSRNINL